MECKFMTGGRCQFGSSGGAGMECTGEKEPMSNCPLWVEEATGKEVCTFGFASQCHFARGRISCDGKKPLDYCPIWKGKPRAILSRILRK